jgi:hypothetical protein
VIAAFTGGVVLAVLLAMSIYDSTKKKAEARAHEVGEMPEPTFPLPALPTIKKAVE